jgi:hypothetical protein
VLKSNTSNFEVCSTLPVPQFEMSFLTPWPCPGVRSVLKWQILSTFYTDIFHNSHFTPSLTQSISSLHFVSHPQNTFLPRPICSPTLCLAWYQIKWQTLESPFHFHLWTCSKKPASGSCATEVPFFPESGCQVPAPGFVLLKRRCLHTHLGKVHCMGFDLLCPSPDLFYLKPTSFFVFVFFFFFLCKGNILVNWESGSCHAGIFLMIRLAEGREIGVFCGCVYSCSEKGLVSFFAIIPKYGKV